MWLAGFKIDGKILPENIYKLYKTIECDVQDVDAVFLSFFKNFLT